MPSGCRDGLSPEEVAPYMEEPRNSLPVEETSLAYDNPQMASGKYPIWFASSLPVIPKTAMTSVWRNIRVSNLAGTGAMSARSIVGVAGSPISDGTLKDVTISAAKPMEIYRAKGIGVFTGAKLK